ncbi:MAG: hypothetical protein Fur0032_23670 [Terrimicrobiaceae bacterium]
MVVLGSLLAGPIARAGAQKPAAPVLTVRFHSEGLEREGPSFVVPVDLSVPPKRIFIRKVPIVSEKNFAKIFPFSGDDGTLGCTFVLDADGRAKVEEYTARERDLITVALIDGRVAAAMRVDRKITDGIITVPKGFTPHEILLLQARHPTVGKEKEFEKQKKEAMASLKKAAKAQAKSEKEAQRKKSASTP